MGRHSNFRLVCFNCRLNTMFLKVRLCIPADGRYQAKVLQRQGTKVKNQTPRVFQQSLDNALRLLYLVDSLDRGVLNTVSDPVKGDGQGADGLGRFVVELSRQPAPFLFLSGDDLAKN